MLLYRVALAFIGDHCPLTKGVGLEGELVLIRLQFPLQVFSKPYLHL